jgi:hypothetical protein
LRAASISFIRGSIPIFAKDNQEESYHIEQSLTPYRPEFRRIAVTADSTVQTKWDFGLSALNLMVSDDFTLKQENGLI